MNAQVRDQHAVKQVSMHKQEAVSRATILMEQQFDLVVLVRELEHSAALRASMVEEAALRRDINELAVEFLEMVVRLARRKHTS